MIAQEVLERCEYFLDTQVWQLHPRINAKRWLENFEHEDVEIALELLESFFFFNEIICKNILKSALQKISIEALKNETTNKQEMWEKFLDRAIFTTVDIDDSNPTASGNLICRWAKQFLKINENKFHSKEVTLAMLNQKAADTVIFLDDIICSGTQFTTTWMEPENVDGKNTSFSKIAEDQSISAYYVPLFATEYGIAEIFKTCRNIQILPGNLLDKRYSATHPESHVWSEKNRVNAQSFLEKYSAKAGIDKWKGFHELALTIAFAHHIPDATLPIFNWNQNGWKPLIEY